MRLGEVRCLKREQILEDTIKVDCSWNVVDGEKSTKSGKIRYVPITKEMRDLLLSISPESGLIFTLDGKKPVKSTTITDKLQKEMEKIGLKYDGKSLSFHSFRHFYNTYLVTNNINGDLIRSVMGHESEEMTDHYCNLCDSEVKTIKDLQMDIFTPFKKTIVEESQSDLCRKVS